MATGTALRADTYFETSIVAICVSIRKSSCSVVNCRSGFLRCWF